MKSDIDFKPMDNVPCSSLSVTLTEDLNSNVPGKV